MCLQEMMTHQGLSLSMMNSLMKTKVPIVNQGLSLSTKMNILIHKLTKAINEIQIAIPQHESKKNLLKKKLWKNDHIPRLMFELQSKISILKNLW